MRHVGVVYLYRHAEGESPVRRFLATYRNHPAGLDHDLHVVFKGFPDGASVARGRALFEGIAVNSIEHADVGYDIGSYLHAANLAPNERLIFLNTFSQILADNWLAHFDHALDIPEVGLVGATGSWLANTGSYEASVNYLMQKVLAIPTTIGLVRSNWRDIASSAMSALHSTTCRIYQYGRYPNPHIRTNAFMIETALFLSLKFSCLATKDDVYKFESGRRSMTKQILRQKLSPVVVDRNGRVYGVNDWKSSSTFWINEQENLIIADNRTADYARADQGLRQRLENLAWVRPWDWNSARADRSA